LRLPFLAAVLVCAVAGCASGSPGVPGVLPVPGAGSSTPLRAGDRVALKVWSNPELAGTFTVAVSGLLALPKIGILAADKMDAIALQDSVVRAYTALVRDPAVEVVVQRRVGVVGEVRQPGIYFADLSMSVADVIAQAGGLTESGSPTKIVVRRGPEQIPLEDHNGMTPLGPIHSGDQIIVGRRGFWARNPGLLVSTVSGLVYFVISRIH
jgi:protein involved in polysaccharide export with SLBB domain